MKDSMSARSWSVVETRGEFSGVFSSEDVVILKDGLVMIPLCYNRGR